MTMSQFFVNCVFNPVIKCGRCIKCYAWEKLSKHAIFVATGKMFHVGARIDLYDQTSLIYSGYRSDHQPSH